ncbi:copper amine oxidase N-terminal domain-containing protein [Paenibacillus mendelii]|uniref:Copper amine oxidase N-terminal domain-containing protein n=1 Tax=Paenibacillus mendelii TaxID=206163 RepID=A0ABV6JC77_9BACL|nr:copper amine oxidase N-terminal domain-containing protein [Paenibacillus mendelii]MCQ6561489.1 copper amine oxidase N-terminal domain-containing protein [Paenibacillus mendelii]
MKQRLSTACLMLTLILAMLSVPMTVSASVPANNEIKVYLDGKQLKFDVPPISDNGRTLVPMRAVFEALNAKVTWNDATGTITGKLNDTTVTVQLDNPIAQINNANITMDVPARIIQGRALVPLRFVSESFNNTIAWNSSTRSIEIYSSQALSVLYTTAVDNKDTSDYWYGNWSSPAERYMYADNDRIHILHFNEGKLAVSDYDKTTYRHLGKTNIPMELPLFGGFHASLDGYYYVVYGQTNMEESNTKSVFAIVKYDQAWKKIGQADIKDVHVTVPFDASNLNMDSQDGKLIVHTARERYLSDDGLHHQSNISFLIQTSDMSILAKGGQWPANHVSHSFAGYVGFDGSRIVYADHGDAYPRSIVLQTEDAGEITSEIDILTFPGRIGDNYTGAHLTGLEVTESNYLVVGSSVSLTQSYGTSSAKNLFISAVPKTATDSKAVKTAWITDYAPSSKSMVRESHISKISKDKYALLWKVETEGVEEGTLFYAIVSGDGSFLKAPVALKGVPSPGNMAPLVQGDTLTWYALEGKQMGIYTLDTAQ